MTHKKTCLMCKVARAVPGLKSKFARVKRGKLILSVLKKEAKLVQRCYPCEADMGLANQFDCSLAKLPEVLSKFHKDSEAKFGIHWKPAPKKEKTTFDVPKTAKAIRGTCKRCKREDRKLHDWLWREREPQRNEWCLKCCREKFLISMHNGLIAHKAEQKRLLALAAQEEELGVKNGKHKRALARSTFIRIKRARSLGQEGNVPMMKRLLKEGKKFKELIKIYTELYHARGQTNAAWIRGRVQSYMRVAER